MKLFLDTSTLIKLYYHEEGTSALDNIFISYTVTEIYLSAIAKVEFSSAMYKKVRTGSLTLQNCSGQFVDITLTADKLLNQFLIAENIKISLPQ